MKPVYKRILLKLSGEVLAGEKGVGIDFDKVLEVCASVKECVDMGVEVAIVVGGGMFGVPGMVIGAGVRAAKWTEPEPTIWACLQPLSMRWRLPTRLSS